MYMYFVRFAVGGLALTLGMGVLGIGGKYEAYGELRITEIMHTSVASPEDPWEWIEVWNTGTNEVNLDGAIFDDNDGNGITAANILAKISETGTQETRIPPGEMAVFYNGSDLGFDTNRFRAAWGLAPTVRLIGVRSPSTLNNSGDAIGLWSDLSSYQSDLKNLDEDEALEVSDFSHAMTRLDFEEGFPTASNVSLQWKLTGDFHDGTQWGASTAGPETSTSLKTFLPDVQQNSTDDVGSPGLVTGVGKGNSLRITEIMVNPASPESDWEWLEIRNDSGVDIDFGATPYILDDDDGGPLAAPNVTSGVLTVGKVAVLFADDVSLQDFRTAWEKDTNGDTLWIPVDRWSGLANGGDGIGLWSGEAGYALDGEGEGSRRFEHAVDHVSFLSTTTSGWPASADGVSIALRDLSQKGNIGSNWERGDAGESSFFAKPVITTQVDHPGGDLGTPGRLFGMEPNSPTTDLNRDGATTIVDADLLCSGIAVASTTTGLDLNRDGRVDNSDRNAFLSLVKSIPGDIDLNGKVEFSDFLNLSARFGMAGSYSSGDVDCDGRIEFSDFLILSANFGQGSNLSVVPEPCCGVVSWMHFWVPLVLLFPRRKNHVRR